MDNSRPLCIDLFCGYGGWARGFLDAGYRVIGFDIEPKCAERYPGEFVLADVRTLDGRRFRHADVIVASPPCTEFTRLRFLRKNPPPPDMSMADAAFRIRKESGVQTIIENVEGARAFLGPSQCHRGPWYLWGDVPLLPLLNIKPKEGQIPRSINPWLVGRPGGPKLLPDGSRPRLQAWGRRRKGADAARERAIVSYPLARALAEACKPEPFTIGHPNVNETEGG